MNVRYLSDVDAENVSKLLKSNSGDIQATFVALGTLIPMNTIKRVKEKKLRPEISDKYFSKGEFNRHAADTNIAQDVKISFTDTTNPPEHNDMKESKYSKNGKRVREEEVLEIYREIKSGMLIKDIAKKHSLTRDTVRRISLGITHKELFRDNFRNNSKTEAHVNEISRDHIEDRNVINVLTNILIEYMREAPLSDIVKIMDSDISLNDIVSGTGKLRQSIGEILLQNELIKLIIDRNI